MQISGGAVFQADDMHEQNSWKGSILCILKNSKTLMYWSPLKIVRERHKMRSEFQLEIRSLRPLFSLVSTLVFIPKQLETFRSGEPLFPLRFFFRKFMQIV